MRWTSSTTSSAYSHHMVRARESTIRAMKCWAEYGEKVELSGESLNGGDLFERPGSVREEPMRAPAAPALRP